MRFLIETLGCKVNQYESQAIAALLTERGHVQLGRDAAGGETVDAVIINTCAVTGDAARQSRQIARKHRRENPGAFLAVCGCASQIEPEAARELGADLVGGSGDRRKLALALEMLVAESKLGEETVNIVDDAKQRREFEMLPPGAGLGRTRAMLKIQDGCDNFCSYCVIPYARGRVRSLAVDDCVDAAKSLAAQGYCEIVLTGIEISSYGKDLGDANLLTVIRAVSDAVGSGVRLRLGSLEPSLLTREFVRELAGISNLCDHFHLSLQSGSDSVLRRMRRKYDTARFYEVLCELRAAFPNCGATADVIAGFPGESDAEHAETAAFVEKCAFSALHVFPYSPRPGTPAAAMDGQLTTVVKKARAAQLRAIGERSGAEFAAAQIGRTLKVIFERESDGVSLGHASNYLEVAAEIPIDAVRGGIASVVVTGVDGARVRADAQG